VFCYCTVILSHCFNTSLSSHFSIHPCFLLLLDVLRFSPSLSASAFAGRFPPFAITGNLPLSPLQGASAFRGCQAPSVGVFRLRHHWVTPHLPFFAERLPLFAITRRFPPFAITGNLPLSPLQGASAFRGCQAPSVSVFRLRHHWVTPHLPFLAERLPLFAITRRLPLSDFFWALSAFRHHQALPLFAVVRRPQWASFAFAITGRPPTYRFSLGALCFSSSLGAFRFRHHWAPSAFAITGRLPLSPLQGASTFHRCRRPRLPPAPSQGTSAFQFRWALSTPIRRPRLLFSPSLGVFRFLPSQGASAFRLRWAPSSTTFHFCFVPRTFLCDPLIPGVCRAIISSIYASNEEHG
jgi:hypothetical protein